MNNIIISNLKEEFLTHLDNWKDEIIEHFGEKDYLYVRNDILIADDFEDFKYINGYFDTFDMDTINIIFKIEEYNKNLEKEDDLFSDIGYDRKDAESPQYVPEALRIWGDNYYDDFKNNK